MRGIKSFTINYNMLEQRPRILFCMHMPPPVHGAAVVGQQIYDSKLFRDSYDCLYINASTSASLGDVGRFSFKKITRTLSFYRQVMRAVRQTQSDLVYFTPSTSGWAFYRDAITISMLRQRKQNIVLHFHNKPTESFLHKWYNDCVWKCFFKGVSAIFLGESLAKQFEKYTSLCKQVYICPNGMQDKLVKEHHSTQLDQAKPFTFLFLSNMIETKGVYVLLEACAQLKQKGYAFCCNFVGQWFDVTKEAFNQKCEQLSITDCVQAYGGKFGEEKDALLQLADALVFPTFYSAECLPLVLIEAMRRGVPCVTTSEGAISDIVVNGETGWIVEKRNASALAEKMQWLIDHPQESLMMGQAGRKRYEQKFTLDVFERRMTEILTECVKNG